MNETVIHPASHISLTKLSRAEGRSSVAAAAYAARTRMHDVRLGRSYDYRAASGLLAEGLVEWTGTAEELWNAAEAAETRRNACTSRELRPALPAELSLEDQARLVRGFACWLRDEHGVAAHWVIHAPRFTDRAEEKALWRRRDEPGGLEDYLAAASDPVMTNLNFHAHIRFTVRRVDAASGAFGEKTREFDRTNPHEPSPEERRGKRDPERKPTGRETLLAIRAEWEKRTNRALERAGSGVRIDLRSYADMAAAGDMPEGLEAQPHLGPRIAAAVRAADEDVTLRIPRAAIERDEARARNAELHASWLTLRALERERARLEGESAAEAARRERRRKKTAEEDRRRIANAGSAHARARAIDAATSIDAPHLVPAAKTGGATEAPLQPDRAETAWPELSSRPTATGPKRPSEGGRPETAVGRPASGEMDPWAAAIAGARRWNARRPDASIGEDDASTGDRKSSRDMIDGVSFETPIDPETYVDPRPETPSTPFVLSKRDRRRFRPPSQRQRVRGD